MNPLSKIPSNIIPVSQFSRIRRDFVKLLISHAIAFGLSWFAVSYIFLGPLPRLRPDLRERVVELPAKVAAVFEGMTAGSGTAGDGAGGGGVGVPEAGGTNSGVDKSISGFFTQAVAYVRSIVDWKGGQSAPDSDARAELPAPWVFGDTVMGPPVTPAGGTGGGSDGQSGSESGATPTPQSPFRIPTGLPGGGGSGPTTAPRVTSAPLPTSRVLPTSATRPTVRPTARPTLAPTRVPTDSAPVSLAQIESGVLAEINRRRKAAGLVELRAQSQLTQAARGHSAYMKRTRQLSHTGEGGSLPHDRAKAAGYRGQPYGETVIVGYPTPVEIVDAWWSSPGHKAILTAPSIREAGVGWSGSYGTALVGL